MLGIITDAAETEKLAGSIKETGNVYLVPAFTGLGAPYWDPAARGALVGITRSTGRAEIARAALEACCYQTADLLRAMAEDGIDTIGMRVDGGMAKNSWFLQYLANILDVGIDRPVITETTALGVAYLAGLQAGLFESFDEIAGRWRRASHFDPQMTSPERKKLLTDWHIAVRRTLKIRELRNS